MQSLKQSTLLMLVGWIFPLTLFSQRSLTVDDLTQWQHITSRAISNDGKWVVANIAPWEGDGFVQLYNQKGEEKAKYFPAKSPTFSASSKYLIVTQTPLKETLDSLKIAKTKKDKMPMNSLIIRSLSGGEEIIDSIRAYKLASEADWIAYQPAGKDSALVVRSLDGNTLQRYPTVTNYAFAEKSGMLYYITKGDTLGTEAGIYLFNPAIQTSKLIKAGKGIFKQPTFNEQGDALAFLYCAEKDSSYHAMDLWLSQKSDTAKLLIDRRNAAIPAEWVINEEGRVLFSKDNKRLFFGTSPEPKQIDKKQLAEYRPDVHVWSWNEEVQYTVQDFNKNRDLKKSYRAVYNFDTGKVLQLTDEQLPGILLPDKGDFALLSTKRPYATESMWKGHECKNIYSVSLKDGNKSPY